ncbi:translation factor GTPase family protein [Micromonospora sp. NPDC000207]|uniref:translation factor GTPase family protein n=1 Tax=Micromonospora sp. NPDC000207 TaxID=3154246 RepID=UPI003328F0AD
MSTLNLGILAHVDAGKTSLTERLLYTVGVIDEMGSVDAGSTRTDSSELERRRGITIRSAVVSFRIHDRTVNLIDTPGHPDFIAEVERALAVLDGAVLVVSAVEGVQAQTRILWRTLHRLRVPTLLFLNKIDRAGARCPQVLADVADRLTPAVLPMGEVTGAGTPAAAFRPYGPADPEFTARLAELVAEHDEALLAAYVADEGSLGYGRLRRALARQTGRGEVHPVLAGSAITGAGVGDLVHALAELLPVPPQRRTGPAGGTIFKIDRSGSGERIAYLRMRTGTVRARERLRLRRDGRTLPAGRITGLGVVEGHAVTPREAVYAGEIGVLRGLTDVRIGDRVGAAPGDTDRQFPPPTLQTVVVPTDPADRSALHTALTRLAEQDPLIGLDRDDVAAEPTVSLYGEVQQEVLAATLAEEAGIPVTFRDTTTIHTELPVGTGAAVEVVHTDTNPFVATVGLRVTPGPVGGVRFRLAVEPGSLPAAYLRAVEEAVRETLRQGLHGWRVTDCTVTMTHSGYVSMISTARDFRLLTPLVLMDALRRAGTVVHEPVHRFRLELPGDTVGALLPVLARAQAVPDAPQPGRGAWVVTGEIPAARVHSLRQRIPGSTRGEGVLETTFAGHRPVRPPVPYRPRTDHNPLNRKEYLLHVVRRV